MIFTCSNCQTSHSFNIDFDVVEYICPGCGSEYEFKNGEQKFLRKGKDSSSNKFIETLKVGNKGTLKGVQYTVIAFVLKKVYAQVQWVEYTLMSASGEIVYLSECDGHWIFLKEVKTDLKIKDRPKQIKYKDIDFYLFEYSNAAIELAKGVFDYAIPNGKIRVTEYINPPFIMSFEKHSTFNSEFLGEHISAREVRNGFKCSLPYKSGVGAVQPFYVNVKNTWIILCITALLILGTHFAVYKNQGDQNILNEFIPFSKASNEFISKSFELKGGSAPLGVKVFSNVDNSWANVQLALVNEGTGEERYASKDIEYYYGYADGERWTEGSTSKDFNICGVPEGKYHLVISVQKAPDDLSNHNVQVRATWNQASSRNLYMIFIFMAVFGAIVYYGEVLFERYRWSESNYSPYNE